MPRRWISVGRRRGVLMTVRSHARQVEEGEQGIGTGDESEVAHSGRQKPSRLSGKPGELFVLATCSPHDYYGQAQPPPPAAVCPRVSCYIPRVLFVLCSCLLFQPHIAVHNEACFPASTDDPCSCLHDRNSSARVLWVTPSVICVIFTFGAIRISTYAGHGVDAISRCWTPALAGVTTCSGFP